MPQQSAFRVIKPVKKLSACCGLTCLGLVLQDKIHFIRCLEGNHQQKCWFPKWYNLFHQTGCICKGKSPGRKPVTQAPVDEVRAGSFLQSMQIKQGYHMTIKHATQQHTNFGRNIWNLSSATWSCPKQRSLLHILNHNFPEKCTGKGGPIPWPPSSPVLTRLKFFFLGTSRMLCTCHLRLPLSWILLGGWELQWLELPSNFSTTCRLKLNTCMISALPLSVKCRL